MLHIHARRIPAPHTRSHSLFLPFPRTHARTLVDLTDARTHLQVIHLKRFQYSRMWRDKIEALVDFPLTGLNLAPWTVSQPPPDLYDLFAVSVSLHGCVCMWGCE